MENNQQPIIVQTSNKKTSAIVYVVGGVVVISGVVLSWREYKKYLARKAGAEYGNNPAVQQAMAIYNAIHTGIPFYENTDAILAAAKEIKDVKEITTIYYKLYKTDFIKDVENSLNPEQLAVFRSYINDNKGPKTAAGSATPKNNPTLNTTDQLLTIASEVNVRKTPTTVIPIKKRSNIVQLVKGVGINLGIATGKTSRDEKGTMFIEFTALAPGITGGIVPNTANLWVSASLVKSFKKDNPILVGKKKLVVNPYNYTLADTSYTAGFSGLLEKYKTIETIDMANIYTNNGQLIKSVEPKIALGIKISELTDKSGNKKIEFVTKQGYQRWVDAKSVKEI